MLRRIALGVVLMLLATCLGAWIASYRFAHGFFIERDGPSVRFVFQSKNGAGVFMWGGMRRQVNEDLDTARWYGGDSGAEGGAWFLGFAPSPILYIDKQGGASHLRFNYSWFAIPLVGICVFLYWPLHRARRRRKRGCCTNCGYDLRMLEEPRCPECGTSTAVKVEQRNSEESPAL